MFHFNKTARAIQVTNTGYAIVRAGCVGFLCAKGPSRIVIVNKGTRIGDPPTKGENKMIDAKKFVIAGLTALALAAPLTACGGSSSTSSDTASSEATETSATTSGPSKEAIDFFTGQWRGSVEVTGETVYGTAGGTEQMLDVNIADDGTCTVVPLEAHADLLNDEGTWDGDTDSGLTLHLSKGDIKLTVVDDATLSGTASDFDIDGFDTINFDFYG